MVRGFSTSSFVSESGRKAGLTNSCVGLIWDRASPETWKCFEDFIAGLAAATELYSRTSENGSFVESVCLGASLVDAMLRIGLILQKQINERTRDIPLELVFQQPSDKPISERDIYRRALAISVIDDSTFMQLQAFYDERK